MDCASLKEARVVEEERGWRVGERLMLVLLIDRAGCALFVYL